MRNPLLAYIVTVGLLVGTSLLLPSEAHGQQLPDTVNLLSPPDGATILSDSVRALWSPGTPNIDRYWVEYGVDSNFAVSMIDSLVIDTTAVFYSLQHHTNYYWRVRAHNADGWGPFSSVRSFLVLTNAPMVPLLVSPPDGAQDQFLTMTFVWRLVSPALFRQIMGSKASSYLDAGIEKKTGGRGPKAPTALQKLEGFSHSLTSTDTVWYHLQLASDSGFATLLLNDSTLVDTTDQVSSLNAGTTYYWRVSARNLYGSSPWSEVWSFTTLAVPAQVVLASPPNGAIMSDLPVICEWFPSAPLVDRYWFEWDTDSTFNGSRVDSLGTDTSAIPSPFQNDQIYYWKVRAHNEAGWGEFSEVWTFTVVIDDVEGEEQIPAVYSVSQNYPNPFNPSTRIGYGLPERTYVRLEVFNVLGEKVSVLKSGLEEAGFHTVVFKADELPSGMYFYRFQAGDFVKTMKLIIMK